MKNHLKRIASPRTWLINRKEQAFIVRPRPGAHPLERGMALGVVMRDMLGLVATLSEAKKVLNNQEILVDGKRRKDHRLIVGLFDVIAIPAMKKFYRMTFDSKGRIVAIDVPEAESAVKVCRIAGKTVMKGGKVQYNLYDGKNVVSTEKAKVGDSFVIELPSLKVKKVLPLKEGITVFLEHGKRRGDVGVVQKLDGHEAAYEADKKNVETLKEYLFVVGDKKSEITVTKA